MRSREKSLFLRHEREVWGLDAKVPQLQEEVASLQTKEWEAHQHTDEAEDKLKAVVAKAGKMPRSLDDSTRNSTLLGVHLKMSKS